MRRSVIAGLAVLVGGTVAVSSIVIAQNTRQEKTYVYNAEEAKHYFDWTTEPWTGTDVAFVKIRQQINAMVTAKKLTDSFLASARAAAMKNPQDAKLQFRWGYAVYQSPRANLRLDNESAMVREVNQMLRRPKSPQSYQYARLRFLLGMWRQTDIRLIDVGRRLLRRNPNDLDVKGNLVSLLAVGTESEKQEALQAAQELVKTHPSASSYYSLGFVYQIRWNTSHNPVDVDKSIAAWRKLLQLTSTKGPYRSDVEEVIRVLEKDKSEWAKRR